MSNRTEYFRRYARARRTGNLAEMGKYKPKPRPSNNVINMTLTLPAADIRDIRKTAKAAGSTPSKILLERFRNYEMPPWLIAWLDESEESSGAMIEHSLKMVYSDMGCCDPEG